MLIESILERNRSFVRGREPHPLPSAEVVALAVVACFDPRLDPILAPSLGLQPSDCFVLRVPGALVRPGGEVLRWLGLAAFLGGVNELLVVGHTSCRMASFTSASFIESFRARGIPRDAFGAGDLREWAGAIADPKRGVQASVDSVAAAPFLPQDLIVAGLVLDDRSGALELVVAPASLGARRGASASATMSAPQAAPAPGPEPAAGPAAGAAQREASPAAPLPSEAAARDTRPFAVGEGAPEAVPSPGGDLDSEIMALLDFLESAEETAGLREDLQRLRRDLGEQRGLKARLKMVEDFVRKSSSASRELMVAFARLRKEASSLGGKIRLDDLVEIFRRRGRPGS